jgi:methionine sulfoxide reductase catalytic subunit
MLIKIPRGWEIPERDATPEHVFWNRRELLAAAGLLGASGLLRGAAKEIESLYPAKRNEAFTLDRPVTEEWAATSYNNFYEFTTDKQMVKNLVGNFKASPWSFEVTGQVNKPGKFDLDDLLRKIPLEERLYRFRCVEAWAMAVPWTGFPFSKLVELVDPKPKAKFVRFVSVNRPNEMPGIRSQPWYPWPYYEGLRMDEAMNPLTLMVTGIYGKPLPVQNGAPVRMIVPWKYGYKSPKSLVKIEFTDSRPSTFWNMQQPGEYGFYSNVNPGKPHPRWSQATEKLIPTMKVVPTQLYNGYQEHLAKLYKGDEF